MAPKLELTADKPGKAVFAYPSEGGAFVQLYVGMWFGADHENVDLTPDEARYIAQALEEAADRVDLETPWP
jgi:hypothetical protein